MHRRVGKPGFGCGNTAKTRNLVVRVRDDAGAHWKYAHVEPVDVVGTLRFIRNALLACGILHPFTNQRLGLWVQRQTAAERLSGALARAVVGCSTDTTARKYRVSRRKRTLQRLRDALRVVAHVVGIRQLQTARLQTLDHGR